MTRLLTTSGRYYHQQRAARLCPRCGRPVSGGEMYHEKCRAIRSEGQVRVRRMNQSNPRPTCKERP